MRRRRGIDVAAQQGGGGSTEDRAHAGSVAGRPAGLVASASHPTFGLRNARRSSSRYAVGSGSSAWQRTCRLRPRPHMRERWGSNPSSPARFCRPGPDAYPADSCRPITLPPPTHDRKAAALANAPKRGKAAGQTEWVAAAVLVNRNVHAPLTRSGPCVST
jgi:hypothetical protein